MIKSYVFIFIFKRDEDRVVTALFGGTISWEVKNYPPPFGYSKHHKSKCIHNNCTVKLGI